jgi:putative flippase GtrA
MLDDDKTALQEKSGMNLAAIFLRDSFDTASIKSTVHATSTLAKKLSVFTFNKELDSEELGIAAANLFHSEFSNSSQGLGLALKTASAKDDYDKYLVFTDGGRLPTYSELAAGVRKNVDFLQKASFFVLSEKYAKFIASSGEMPSAENASKNGYSVPLSIPEMIKSPRKALAQNPVVFKFMAVGLSGVLVNLAVGLVLKTWIPKLYANATAVEVSIGSNFYFNDVLTFKSRNQSIEKKKFARFYRFVKYNIVSLAGLALNELVFYVMSSHGISYVPSSLVAIAAAFILNYFGSSRWAWREVLRH